MGTTNLTEAENLIAEARAEALAAEGVPEGAGVLWDGIVERSEFGRLGCDLNLVRETFENCVTWAAEEGESFESALEALRTVA